ncbi:MAG: hypothetical protein A2Z14_19945 [Chloroflexi bacterium RBG_16_48_8]|nr:MAG: hypothetical protein A2Z14_19945 [Chloroflexi bacterium RBG_16_48_8]
MVGDAVVSWAFSGGVWVGRGVAVLSDICPGVSGGVWVGRGVAVRSDIRPGPQLTMNRLKAKRLAVNCLLFIMPLALASMALIATPGNRVTLTTWLSNGVTKLAGRRWQDSRRSKPPLLPQNA